ASQPVDCPHRTTRHAGTAPATRSMSPPGAGGSEAMTSSGARPFRDLVDQFQRGYLDRRRFIARAAALGVAPAVATFVASAAPAVASGGSRNGFALYAQDATPAAAQFPDAGMEGRTRGEGG